MHINVLLFCVELWAVSEIPKSFKSSYVLQSVIDVNYFPSYRMPIIYYKYILHKEGKPLKFIAEEAGCSQSAPPKHINRKLRKGKVW